MGTLQEIGFHTIMLMISTYPSTIQDKSSASFAHTTFYLWRFSYFHGAVRCVRFHYVFIILLLLVWFLIDNRISSRVQRKILALFLVMFSNFTAASPLLKNTHTLTKARNNLVIFLTDPNGNTLKVRQCSDMPYSCNSACHWLVCLPLLIG